MMRVEKSVVINKPVAEVFAFSQDIENAAEWQGEVELLEMVSGPDHTVGSQFNEVRKLLGKELKTTLEITEFVENKTWAAKVVKGPVPYEVKMTYESVPDGTRITTVVEGEPKGFFKLAENMVASSIEKNLEADYARLKKMME